MLTRAFLKLLLLTAFTVSASAQDVFYFPQIGDGAIGTIRFQTSLIFVNTGPARTIVVEFFGTGDGAPLEVDLGGLGAGNRFEIPLGSGESISVQTPGTGGIIVGYARITVPAGGSVGGTAVFTRTHAPTGTILYEAGVPASRDLNEFTLFVDTIGDRDTGLAMVNTEAPGGMAGSGNEVRLDLYDLRFNQVATTVIPFPGGAHRASFVPEFFDAVPAAAEMEGTLAVSSPDDLAAVTLRTNDAPGVVFPDEVPTLTAFPVVPGSAAAAAGFSGSLALQSGTPVLSLRLPPEEQPEGVLLLLYQRGRLVDVEFHALDAVPARERSIRLMSAVTPDRVEAELVFGDGKRFPSLILVP